MPHEQTPVAKVAGQAVVLDADHVDTDQIIPARYLTTTSREGLGEHAFHALRFNDNGAPRHDSPFDGENAGRPILIAGENFGCGSSREHAPWAMADIGLKAVLAKSLADIFRANALKNGLVAVELDDDAWAKAKASAEQGLTVDVQAQEVIFADGERAPFAIDPFARRCLLDGVDQLGFLLAQDEPIAAHERIAG